jgi:hypothetical protein
MALATPLHMSGQTPMIRTACLAATLLAGTLLPATSASASVSIYGSISQIVMSLSEGSRLSRDFSLTLDMPGGARQLFKGLKGVRQFNDFGTLNDWVQEQARPDSVFTGAPYTFTHGAVDGYFDGKKDNSPFDGGPYKFTHSALGNAADPAQPEPEEHIMMIDAPLEPIAISAPPVPEPASWALMIGGFALTGATLRTRRAVLSPA